MLIITEMARIPLKMPMMLPLAADGSVSPCVVVGAVSGDVVGVVEPVVTRTPVKSHHQSCHC